MNKNILKILVPTAVTLLVISTLFILDRTGTIRIFHKSNSNIATDSSKGSSNTANSTPNNVDYGPAKPEDIPTNTSKNPSSSNPIADNQPLTATIVSTRMSSDSTKYLVKVVVAGATSGECNATLTNGASSVTAKSDISMVAGQVSCTDLSIPMDQLNVKGDWSVDVTVTDPSGKTASTHGQAII